MYWLNVLATLTIVLLVLHDVTAKKKANKVRHKQRLSNEGIEQIFRRAHDKKEWHSHQTGAKHQMQGGKLLKILAPNMKVRELDILEHITTNQDENVQSRKKRGASADYLWPWGIIPIFYDFFFGDLRLAYGENFQYAMAEWERNTCVKFINKTDETDDKDAVMITNGLSGECFSSIGKTIAGNGGLNTMNIGDTNCSQTHTLIHEFGHIIGLYHEQTRMDRKRSITINYDNIKDDMDDQFDVREDANLNSLEYDMLSIMHYSNTTFSKDYDNLETITPKNDSFSEVMGRRRLPSFSDYMTVNMMYKCDQNCTADASPCPSGSYRGKDCNCYCSSNDGEETVLCSESTTPATTVSPSATTPKTTPTPITTPATPATTVSPSATTPKTTPKTTPTPTTTTTPVCEDKDSKCVKRSKGRGCTNKAVQTDCPSSCKLCSADITNTDCEDKDKKCNKRGKGKG